MCREKDWWSSTLPCVVKQRMLPVGLFGDTWMGGFVFEMYKISICLDSRGYLTRPLWSVHEERILLLPIAECPNANGTRSA